MNRAVTPMRMAIVAGVGIVAWWFVLAALAGLLSGCATGPTPAGIARDLDRQLTMLADWPLSVRCQAVTDAERRCERAGLERRCFADGWNDADHDAWTIAACKARRTP